MSNIHQEKAQRQVLKNQELLWNVCHTPIVRTKEAAQQVYRGLKKIAKMPEEALEKLLTLSGEELKKKYSEGDVAAAAVVVQKAFDMVHDAMAGRIEKAMSFDNMRDPMARELVVNTGIQTAQSASTFDMGWTLVYNVISAENADTLKVVDINAMTMMYEQLNNSDDIKFSQFSSRKAESISPRFFAGGIDYSPRELAKVSAFDVNTLLTSLRIAAVRMADRVAYRKLAEITSDTNNWDPDTFNVGFTGGSDDEEKLRQKYLRARSTMNKARKALLDAALQVQPSIGKKKLKVTGTPIPVSSNTPMYFFHHYKWDEFIRDMRNQPVNTQGAEVSVTGNYVFVSSALMPVSGGLTRTANEDKHDDYGLYETVTEVDNADAVAGMMVIPGHRMIYGQFRQPTFVTKSESLKETIQVALKMEANATKENRQCARVKLGTEIIT